MIRLTNINEINNIVNISKRAFASDISIGAKSAGGPPMYDSLKWHLNIQKNNFLYSIIEDNRLVGGMIIYPNHCNKDIIEIGRIFIDPDYFRRGYGFKAMANTEDLFPIAKGFILDTPTWNQRTISFYTKLGYKRLREEKEQIVFIKMR